MIFQSETDAASSGFTLVSLCVQWHINLHGLFYTIFLWKNIGEWFYLIYSWSDKGVQTFPKKISPKMNETARLEFELAYFSAALQLFRYYITGIPTTLLTDLNSFVLFHLLRRLTLRYLWLRNIYCSFYSKLNPAG